MAIETFQLLAGQGKGSDQLKSNFFISAVKHKNPIWMLSSLAVLILTFAILCYLVNEINTSPEYFERDFVTYWSAGRLLVSGNNPYDQDQIFMQEKMIGWERAEPNRFWNPPWTLPFLIPFGLLKYSIAAKLWFLLNMSLIIICADRIWKFYDGPIAYRWVAWISAALFFPTYYVLWMGQISVIVLFGTVGVLVNLRNQNMWLASIFTIMATIKPHVVYLLWAAILLWIIGRRQWLFLLGMVFALTGASLIAVLMNPDIIRAYYDLNAKVSDIQFAIQTPTMGIALRKLLGPEKILLQYIPPIIGLAWFSIYWSKHKGNWNWEERAPILLLLSLISAIFTWGHDQILIILPVMHVVVLLFSAGLNRKTVCLVMIYLAINIMAIFFIVGNAFMYIWMAPSFLLWYLFSMKYLQRLNVNALDGS